MNATRLRYVPATLLSVTALALFAGCGRSYGYISKVVHAGDGELTVRDEQQQTQQTHEVASDAQITLDGQPAALDELETGDTVELKVEPRGGKEVATDIKAKSKETVDSARSPLGPAPDAPRVPDRQSTQPLSESPSSPAFEPTPEDGMQNPPKAPLPQTENDKQMLPLGVEEEAFHGKIASLGDKQFVVEEESGEKKTFAVNDDTKYTVEGREASFTDLKVGQMVDVTAQDSDEMLVAKTADATSD